MVNQVDLSGRTSAMDKRADEMQVRNPLAKFTRGRKPSQVDVESIVGRQKDQSDTYLTPAQRRKKRRGRDYESQNQQHRRRRAPKGQKKKR